MILVNTSFQSQTSSCLSFWFYKTLCSRIYTRNPRLVTYSLYTILRLRQPAGNASNSKFQHETDSTVLLGEQTPVLLGEQTPVLLGEPTLSF